MLRSFDLHIFVIVRICEITFATLTERTCLINIQFSKNNSRESTNLSKLNRRYKRVNFRIILENFRFIVHTLTTLVES